MHKNLIYSLIAAFLGVLLVVTPLFLAPIIGNLKYPEAESTPQKFSERMKVFEHIYESRENLTQTIFNNMLIFTVGFAAAVVVHLLVKAKFPK